MESRSWSCTLAFVLLALLNASPAAAGGEGEKVLTLDHSNFTETVSKHDFIVVAFYAPWCFYSKALAPEYEKTASTLSKHEPPIILAKVDAYDEANRELATEFEIYGFPTIKILRNGGKHIRGYYGPREAYCFVDYLKKQVGPASAEIKSLEDATNLLDEKKIFVVGVFPKFSGEEYENFMTLAEKLRSDYWGICFNTDYGIAHTLDAKFLPRGEPVDKPTLRLLKPFDELFVDFQDFKVDAMEKFIGEASIPLVTVRDNDPSNHPYINKFFESSNAKDATVNDIPSDTFDVQGYPTLYFRSSSGNLLPYDGERTKEDIVDFIQKNQDSHADPISTKSEAVDTDSVKDKL